MLAGYSTGFPICRSESVCVLGVSTLLLSAGLPAVTTSDGRINLDLIKRANYKGLD